MPSHSYNEYIKYLRERTKPSLFKKSLFITLLVLITFLGVISAFFYLKNQQLPIIKQEQYLQIASGGFNSSKQSLEEVLTTFKVAGAKIGLVDSAKEATSSSLGFFTTLDDLNKILAKIEAAQKNIYFQRDLLKERLPPQEYFKLNDDLIAYYDNSQKLLDEVYQEHIFAKELLTASGPNFYLPILTNESLWQQDKKEEIVNYYQITKTEADSTLENLSRLTVPASFRNYLGAQTAYLELVVKVANNIINTLAQEDEKNDQNATQLEKAYQILIGAKRENEILSQKLLSEKLRLFDLKQNLAKFAPVTISQNSLQAQLADIATSQKQKKTWLINAPRLILNIKLF